MSETFNYDVDYSITNFRDEPQKYQIGRGEQGVLMVEPYKSEILPFWRFKTPAEAQVSAEKIYQLYLGYKEQNDFVGMDMSRKYLQMGFTRARRYANHASGSKYEGKKVRAQAKDWATNEKAQSAAIFKSFWDMIRVDPEYLKMKAGHKKITLR